MSTHTSWILGAAADLVRQRWALCGDAVRFRRAKLRCRGGGGATLGLACHMQRCIFCRIWSRAWLTVQGRNQLLRVGRSGNDFMHI